MPASVSPSVRNGFDYSSLDTATSDFVRQQTGDIKVLMKRAAQDIFEVGQKLISVKSRLKHGQFGEWLYAEFAWTERTAQQFMNVARQFKNENFSDLQFAPSALYILSAPSIPEAARAEALSRAEAGENISFTTAKAIKQKYSPASTKPHLKDERKENVEVERDRDADERSPSPSPTLLPQPSPKQEIVRLLPKNQTEISVEASPAQPQTMAIATSQPNILVEQSEETGIWWQLGKHLLYCGDPNSREFLERVPEKPRLLFAFAPTPTWLPAIKAKTQIVVEDYLPHGRNIDQFDENLESNLLFHSNLNDAAVVCFLPIPEIISVVNRLDRRGFFADPNEKNCKKVIDYWKAGRLKVERIS
jgi:hypothetical protein